MGKRKPAVQLVGILHNWNELNSRLMRLGEADVRRLLSHEKKHDNRITFVMRLHSRLNKLRRERERRALYANT